MTRGPRHDRGAFVPRALAVLRTWRELGRAQGALIRSQRQLRRQPLGRLLEIADTPTPGKGVPMTHRQLEHAEGLATAISRMARFGLFRPRCLVRSMALHQLLQADGVTNARVRIGVRTAGVPGLDAHAWVEVDSRVLGDDVYRAPHFVPLAVMQPRGGGR